MAVFEFAVSALFPPHLSNSPYFSTKMLANP